MSEMALTAEHLVVIGQGRLLADDSVEAVVAASGQNTRPRPLTPRRPARRAPHRQRRHRRPAPQPASSPSPACPPTSIGDLAAANGITIHELSPSQASLEEAFMELTHDSVEYRTNTHASAPHQRKRSLIMTDATLTVAPTTARRRRRRPQRRSCRTCSAPSGPRLAQRPLHLLEPRSSPSSP